MTLEIPSLPSATVLLVEVGSTAHGTGLLGGEDHDEIAVVVESPGELEALANDDALAPGPERERIETWLVDVHLRFWSANG